MGVVRLLVGLWPLVRTTKHWRRKMLTIVRLLVGNAPVSRSFGSDQDEMARSLAVHYYCRR